MNKNFLIIAFLLGAFSVILGAFAAHTLKQLLNEYQLSIFETAVRYQFYHVFALALAGMIYKDYSNKKVYWAGVFFIAGIIFFSGSLYTLTYLSYAQITTFKWLGAITPLGGLCFILGWAFLAYGIIKNK